MTSGSIGRFGQTASKGKSFPTNCVHSARGRLRGKNAQAFAIKSSGCHTHRQTALFPPPELPEIIYFPSGLRATAPHHHHESCGRSPVWTSIISSTDGAQILIHPNRFCIYISSTLFIVRSKASSRDILRPFAKADANTSSPSILRE